MALHFVTGKPIQAKVTWITTEVPLWAAQLTDSGWLLADFKEADGSLTRYAVPPASVTYVKQSITVDELGVNFAAPAVVQQVTAPVKTGD